MKTRTLGRRSKAVVLALGVAAVLAGCGKKEEPAAAAAPAAPAAPAAAPPPATPAAAPAPVTAAEVANQTWTAEALEDLLAPVALYPDPVLSQVLIASTNPQEVLDAGNWLIANESLKGKALDDGAAQAGFTPPIRALVQFPQTVDLMCMELGWTTELGQAFVADQAGVLAAVQRLRKQAIDVGNLQTSQAMIVETQQQEGQEVVVLKPPKPEVVYVPTYDPQAVYAPPPATAAAPAAPAAAPATYTTPTTMTPVEDKTKYSTGNMITTGLLAFGAGILVNEVFDDDDHHNNHYNDYYYPNYGYGGMPYYPPYPYRPVYGGGYYPSNNYNRPPNYNNGGFQNNGNIYINTGNNDYWNRYGAQPRPAGLNNATPYTKQARTVSSPITKANPNRKDLQQLNQRQPRPMPTDYKRPAPNATASNWKGQSTYAGKDKRPASAKTPQERIDAATPRYAEPPSKARPGTGQAKVPPKVSGSYAGKDRPRPTGNTMPNTRDLAKPPQRPETRDVQKPAKMPQQKPQSRDAQRPQPKPMPAGDRGYGASTRDMQRPTAAPQPMNRPSPGMQQGGGGGKNKGSAMSGAGGNRQSANAASQRGKQSMPQGARSKGGGGGGKNKNKQAR